MKAVFINPERCLGCRQCEFACAVAHSRSGDPSAAAFEDPPPRARIHAERGAARQSSLPVRCRQCTPAPCEQACPTGSMHRVNGTLLVDGRKCIACAMCGMVCPFAAVTYHASADVTPPRVMALKCDDCLERQGRGELPACVEACKSGALVFGELTDLVRSGRLREAGLALAAAAQKPVAATLGPALWAAYRGWGESASSLFHRPVEGK